MLPIELVLQLQQTVGNREVTRILARRAEAPPPDPEPEPPRSTAWLWLIPILGCLLGASAGLLLGSTVAIVAALAAAGAILGLLLIVFLGRAPETKLDLQG